LERKVVVQIFCTSKNLGEKIQQKISERNFGEKIFDIKFQDKKVK